MRVLDVNPTDRKYHDYVLKWLAEEFEIKEVVPADGLDCTGCIWLNIRHQKCSCC